MRPTIVVLKGGWRHVGFIVDGEVCIIDDDGNVRPAAGMSGVSYVEVEMKTVMPPNRHGQTVTLFDSDGDGEWQADLIGWLVDTSENDIPPKPIVAPANPDEDVAGVVTNRRWRINP